MPNFRSAVGTTLHYELRGQGPVLVCHPGGPGRPVSYLDTLGGLDHTRTLLLLDPRGVGKSAPGGPYGFVDVADDLEGLREHLGVETLDLLGHSAGAWPALAHAARHPDRVRRLILLTPSRRLIPPLDGEPDQGTLAERYFGDQPWFSAALGAYRAFDPDLPELEKEVLSLASAPLFYGVWDAAARAHASRPGDSTAAPEPRDRFWDSPFEPAALAAVRAPTRVIVGDRDIVTGREAPVVLAGWLAQGSVTSLPGCGHFPWLDDPGAVTAAVEDALSDTD